MAFVSEGMTSLALMFGKASNVHSQRVKRFTMVA